MNQESDRELKERLVSLKFNDHEYTFWTNAEIVLPHVYHYLTQIYPNDFILSEFNFIDFVVLGENLPVEVQSTIILRRSDNEKKVLAHSYFEQMIGKQIRQNVERYGKCWFFFDSEYFRYLRSEGSISRKLDFGWFVDYVRDHLLRIFIIDYTGVIDEISHDDLRFLVKSYDDKMLVFNKITILSEVIRGYGYTSDEIREYYRAYMQEREQSKKGSFIFWLKKKEQPARIKTLAYILFAISGEFKHLEDFFSRTKFDWNRVRTSLSFLGVLEYKNNKWTLEDHYDVLKYFPGYNKNNLFWDGIRNKQFGVKDFKKLVYED